MPKLRLDQTLASRKLTTSRSQAESYIRLGEVTVNGLVITKAGYLVRDDDVVVLATQIQYVSRAGLKLASVASTLGIDFRDKTVLDVGSSTGGFTDYALKHGARRVIAVEVGSHQLHPTLLNNPQIELHEQTDIRNFETKQPIDIVVIDVSFISLRDILPHISKLATKTTQIIAMVKPQFEAGQSALKHKGVVKNDKMRRDILKDFELWSHATFVIIDKADSDIAGAKGNHERFYHLRKA